MDGKEREQCDGGEKGWSAKKGKTGEELRQRQTDRAAAHGTAQNRKNWRTNGTKRKEEKCWIEGWERRQGHLFFSLSSSRPSSPPRENAACVYFLPRQICCAFIRTQRRDVDVPGTGGREGAGRGVCVRERQIKRHWLTCLADEGACERVACLSEMSHLTLTHTLNLLNTNVGSLSSVLLSFPACTITYMYDTDTVVSVWLFYC